MPSPLIEALQACVGLPHVLTEGDLSAYTVDWRRRFHGRAAAVVLPGSTQEVAAVVRACAAHGASVVPQGGNTGLVGGGVPSAHGTQVLLSLRRMNRVRGVDAANLTLVAEAGCILQSVQEAAEAAGLLFPLSLAAEGSCTIGGNLATNAGGTAVLRYGNTRELCLGLEVVLADGQIWEGLGGLRKDNTGYDLRDLFIGSEGTLGIITAATLKLSPTPATVGTATAALDRLDDVVRFLGLAQQRLGPALTGFEAMNRFSLQLVAKHFPQYAQPLGSQPWVVLLEQSDSQNEVAAHAAMEALLEDAMTRGWVQDAAVAQSMAQARTMWHLRESIPLAQSLDGLNIKSDIALPASRIVAFVQECDAALERALPGCRIVNFGHIGDGNLHYNIQAPEGGDAGDFLARCEGPAQAIVYDAVQRHGGSFSAEHGIGALKVEELQHRKSPVALQLMRAIKDALDPQNRLNPGRVLPS